MAKNYKKILILTVVVFLTAGVFVVVQEARADVTDNVYGWAWSENIGWISFNCTNTGICATSNYGVNIDTGTGQFSGYAWSENIGWISFDDAQLDLITFEVSGWARALANGDGWDGWIKMRGTWADGVTLNTGPDPSEFEGWAWGDVIVGWVSFNSSNTGAGASYSVKTDFNLPPSAINLNVTEGNYCFASNPPIFLNWTFDDLGDSQSAYQIQIDNSGAGFPSPEIDTGKVSSSSGSYAPINLSFGTQYWWRLMVWDSGDKASDDWIYPSPSSFTTDLEWPEPDFTWDPLNPVADYDIDFDSTTQYCAGCSYAWDFGDGSSDNVEDPTYAFSVMGNYSVILTSTSGPRSCPISHIVSVGAALPLPTWQEIPPF